MMFDDKFVSVRIVCFEVFLFCFLKLDYEMYMPRAHL